MWGADGGDEEAVAEVEVGAGEEIGIAALPGAVREIAAEALEAWPTSPEGLAPGPPRAFLGTVVARLRLAGHDVAWIRIDQPGSADRDVLARAQEERRILLTFDKDFGELAWRERLPAVCGVVLFRLSMPAPTDVGRVIAEIVNGRSDWAGHLSVVGGERLRMRPLPTA